MRMQEPEQRQQFGQEWQASQEFDGYHAEYLRYESEQQQEYSAGLAADDYQGQKIYPQKEPRQRGKVLAIIAIVVSSLGFFITLAGIIISGIALRYANGQEEKIVRGVIGLVGSLLVMFVCVAIFVVAVITLSIRAMRRRRQTESGYNRGQHI